MDVMMAQILAEATQIILPPWVTTLILAALSTAVTGIVGVIVKKSLDRYFTKKETQEADLQQKLQELQVCKDTDYREQRRADMIDIVKSEIAPINEKMDVLMDKVSKTEDGTLSSLRNDILTCYYRCLEKGYRGDWDFENIHHLYEAYKELHGNSFVHDVMNRFDELPTKEEYTIALEKETKRKKSRNKKDSIESEQTEEDF